jgi:hypothetical protein
MTNVAESIEQVIAKRVKEQLDNDKFPALPEYVATDNLGEVIEKLVILHIRTWYLEDAIQAATSDEVVADLKRKVDQCFKVKRPRFVTAINMMVDDAIKHNKSVREDSVKLYKGIQ